MAKVLYIINREIELLFKKRKSMAFFAIIFPLIIFFLVLSVFNQKVLSKVPVAVVDNSKGFYSREFIRTLNASPYADVKYEATSHKEAYELFEHGAVYAVINIEPNYDKNILNSHGGSIGIFLNSQYMLLSSTLNKAVLGAAEELSVKYRAKTLFASGLPYYAADSFIAPLSVTENTLFNPQMNYVYFLVLGIIPALIQLFASMSIIYSLMSELKSGKAKEIRRILAKDPSVMVFSKILVYLVLYGMVMTVMLVSLHLFFALPMRGSLTLIILGGMAFVLFTGAVSVMIAGTSQNLRMAVSTGAIYSAPAFAYFGVSFPVGAMPVLARVWAEMMPGTHYNRILVNEIMRGAGAYYSIREIVVLICVSTLLIFVGSRLYSRRAGLEQHWGPEK